MKKLLLLVAVLAILLPGCKKIEESIDALENRIDKLEQETIPTIDEQIAAINLSLDALEKADEELGKYIQDLEAVAADLQEQINDTNTKIDEVKAALQGEISAAKEELLAQLEETKAKLEAELATINSTIETLKAKDAELDKKIEDLKSYVDTELGKTTDWVSATFATLEQFYALSDNVAALKTLVDANKAESAANLATAIANLETSLKAWVGEQLSNYYTIAEVDAKILALQSALAAGDSALREELNNLKSELEAAKSELTEAYKKAIEDAITTNNGVINAKITNEIAAVNSRIDSEVAEINAKIAAIEKRLSDVEGRVSTIEEQIKAINASIANLEKTDEELGKYIKDLEATADNLQKQIDATNTKIDEVKSALQNEISTAKADVLAQLDAVKAELEAELATINATIETLKAKDAELDKKIADLKSYVDTELGKTTDWVNATFATLTQYNALVAEVTAIKAQIEAINKSIADLETRLTTKINEDIATAVATLNTTIQQKVKEITDAYTAAIKAAKDEVTKAYTAAIATAISNLETSLKKWVGEQLSNYYTIAEIEAKIAALEKAIADGDKALQQQLNELKSQLESAKAELTEAYKKAIEEAITENNGVINTKIASEIAAVNKRIDEEVAAINAKIAALQVQVDKNSSDIAKLLARIQSVSYVPQYSDGKAQVTRIGAVSEVILDFKVSPKECVAELEKVWSEALSCEAVYTKTRAVSLVKMPVTEFVADAENGIITVTASGENLSEEFFAGTQEASVALVISDGNNSVTSEYVPMATKEITDEIWYTTTDNQPLTPNHEGVDIFGANIVSNNYNEEFGWFVLKFDAPVTKIGEYAFGVKKAQRDEVDSTLKDIILPNSVTSIESWAFAWCCDNLTSISIPKSVASIGQTVFGQCKSLETIDLKNINTIGNYIFYDCSGLKSVNLSTDLTTIPFQAFYGCSSLTSIAIPASVTSIGEDAFYGCKALERVDITDLAAWCKIDLYHYLSSPMYYAKSIYLNGVEIIDLVIPTEITEIKTCSFFSWDHITSVTLHEGITSIGYDAIASCDYLTSVTIPNSVTTITEGALRGGGKLSSFYGKFATEDHRALVIDNTLISVAQAGLTSYRVPDGITRIGDLVFKKTKINTITIPSSVTSIGYQSLMHISNTNIVIFEGTTPPSLGKSALSGIEGQLFVPAEAVDTYKSAWTQYADYIRPYEEGMNIITYTSTDGNIVTPYSGERNEFQTIESLFNAKIISNTYENGEGKIVFDGVVSKIGTFAFYNCKTLKSIILPNGVVALGSDTFHECRNLADVTLNNGLKTIYYGAFHFCDALKSLTIPDSVNDIREQAFFNCGLDYIYSKNSTADNRSLIEDNNLHWVAKSYPAGDYIIPDGVVKIANNAFGYPKNVISITLPESIETFSSHPFIGVYNISAFYGKYTTDDHRAVIKDSKLYAVAANGITEYVVPDGVKEIAYRMLRACKLTTITLPASLEIVGGNLFEDAAELKYVYCKAVVPPAADNNLFLRADKVEKIYVPSQSVEAYKAAAGWSTKADKIVGYDF